MRARFECCGGSPTTDSDLFIYLKQHAPMTKFGFNEFEALTDAFLEVDVHTKKHGVDVYTNQGGGVEKNVEAQLQESGNAVMVAYSTEGDGPQKSSRKKRYTDFYTSGIKATKALDDAVKAEAAKDRGSYCYFQGDHDGTNPEWYDVLDPDANLGHIPQGAGVSAAKGDWYKQLTGWEMNENTGVPHLFLTQNLPLDYIAKWRRLYERQVKEDARVQANKDAATKAGAEKT